jgi:hypothetical protein
MRDSALTLMERDHTDIAEAFTRVHDEHADRSAEIARLVASIASHVAVERTYVYPLAKKLGSRGSRLAAELLSDYRKMQKLLVKIDRRKTNSPDMPDLVDELLATHERHHERAATIHSHIAEHLHESDRAALERKMAGAKRVIVSHPHPFLLRLGGPLYGRTTRLASRWDSWRDRTVRNR